MFIKLPSKGWSHLPNWKKSTNQSPHSLIGSNSPDDEKLLVRPVFCASKAFCIFPLELFNALISSCKIFTMFCGEKFCESSVTLVMQVPNFHDLCWLLTFVDFPLKTMTSTSHPFNFIESFLCLRKGNECLPPGKTNLAAWKIPRVKNTGSHTSSKRWKFSSQPCYFTRGFFLSFFVAPCGHPTACLFVFLRPISGHN